MPDITDTENKENMIKPRNNILNPEQEMKNLKRRILVFPKEKGFLFFVVNRKRIIYWGEETEDSISAGNIYVGKINHIQENINGIFVEVRKKINVFLPGEELNHAVLLNRLSTGRFHAGDEIIVQIKKEAYKTKLAVATTRLNIPGQEDLLEKARHVYPYTCLFHSAGALKNYLQHNPLKEGELLLTEQEPLYQKLLQDYPFFSANIKWYQETQLRMPVLYSMTHMLEAITQRKVWLKSGGFLVIDTTEAMTVIDVNSGKIQKGHSRDETILTINLEALEEIVYQLTARNISGIIIIDFINMSIDENKTILQQSCRRLFSEAIPPIQYVDYTKLGLVEATRAKQKIDIYEFVRQNNITILL